MATFAYRSSRYYGYNELALLVLLWPKPQLFDPKVILLL